MSGTPESLLILEAIKEQGSGLHKRLDSQQRQIDSLAEVVVSHARIEERMRSHDEQSKETVGRIFKTTDKLDERLEAIENEVIESRPMMRLLSHVVTKVVTGAVVVGGGAAVAYEFIKDAPL